MKVSKSMQAKIISCGNQYEKALKLNDEIREWLVSNNLANDTIIDQFIDGVEMGNNKSLEFIEFLENESHDFIGNDENRY